MIKRQGQQRARGGFEGFAVEAESSHDGGKRTTIQCRAIVAHAQHEPTPATR